MSATYDCHYVGCTNLAAQGGFCGWHEEYVNGATTTLDAEAVSDQ